MTWSPEDNEHVALCAEFPSLSWLAKAPESALKGIQEVVVDVVADMLASGELRVRIPPMVHRQLALKAAEQGVSRNRLASAKLAA